MNLERVAALANEHDRDAAAIAQYGAAFASRSLQGAEHAEIAELARLYLSAVQRENILRDKFAGLAMQGLLSGMSSEPTTPISGPQIAVTAYDIAACMMDERERVSQL